MMKKKRLLSFAVLKGRLCEAGLGGLSSKSMFELDVSLNTYCETSSPHFLRSVMLPPCVIFIERINNEININVLKKKIWPKRREYFNDFKMADLNLFCFVLFFFWCLFFSSFLHRMIVVKY